MNTAQSKIFKALDEKGACTMKRLLREVELGLPRNDRRHFRREINFLISKNLVRETEPELFIIKPPEAKTQTTLF